MWVTRKVHTAIVKDFGFPVPLRDFICASTMYETMKKDPKRRTSTSFFQSTQGSTLFELAAPENSDMIDLASGNAGLHDVIP